MISQDLIPKVSIALITYNQQEFIKECLMSIINQSWKNIEINIADDGSSDNTREEIKKIIQKFPKVFNAVIFHKRNHGIAKNLRSVVSKCTGDYIVPFSGDDIMTPDKISTQVETLEVNPKAVFCYSNTEWFFSKYNIKLCKHFGLINKIPQYIGDVMKDFCIPSMTLMIRKEYLSVSDIDDFYNIASDYVFIINLMLKGDVIYIPKVLVKYRKHFNSITSKTTFYEERFQLVENLQKKLPQYSSELNEYKKIAYYARARYNLVHGNFYAGMKDFRRIYHCVFISFKWTLRILRILASPIERLMIKISK
ncbi:MAG: glycosyltransferase [Legionellales bacterium]|nr:glycosyltransferase [Legionellales bacterium]